jgi:deazaflavin-dependent oxidoreductase (nitroreductase family)
MPVEGEYEPSPEQWVREQVEQYERTGGREGSTLPGRTEPVVVFTTRGAKSGKVRKNPLMKVEHDGVYAMVASLGGAPKHPTWYFNVTAHPDEVTVQDGDRVWDGVAREIDGAEYEQWWERAVAAFHDYADYQRKTERKIPIVLVEPRR